MDRPNGPFARLMLLNLNQAEMAEVLDAVAALAPDALHEALDIVETKRQATDSRRA